MNPCQKTAAEELQKDPGDSIAIDHCAFAARDSSRDASRRGVSSRDNRDDKRDLPMPQSNPLRSTWLSPKRLTRSSDLERLVLTLALGATLLLALALPALAQDADEEPSGWQMPASWTNPVEPFQIADHLYYVGTEQLSAFLFVTPAGLILLDAPMQENVDKVLASIRKLGFDPRNIRYLIASHGHFDHVGGIASIQEATGAEIVLSEKDAPLVANGGRGDFFLGSTAPYAAATADRILSPGDVLRLGGLELEANLTAGHTRGCTSWSAVITVAGKPHKMVVVCSLTVLDGYQLTGATPSYEGIARDFCSSVRTLRQLGADLFLASHPSFFSMAKKARTLSRNPQAFVDPEGFDRYLNQAAASIDATLAEQGVSEGCSGVE